MSADPIQGIRNAFDELLKSVGPTKAAADLAAGKSAEDLAGNTSAHPSAVKPDLTGSVPEGAFAKEQTKDNLENLGVNAAADPNQPEPDDKTDTQRATPSSSYIDEGTEEEYSLTAEDPQPGGSENPATGDKINKMALDADKASELGDQILAEITILCKESAEEGKEEGGPEIKKETAGEDKVQVDEEGNVSEENKEASDEKVKEAEEKAVKETLDEYAPAVKLGFDLAVSAVEDELLKQAAADYGAEVAEELIKKDKGTAKKQASDKNKKAKVVAALKKLGGADLAALLGGGAAPEAAPVMPEGLPEEMPAEEAVAESGAGELTLEEVEALLAQLGLTVEDVLAAAEGGGGEEVVPPAEEVAPAEAAETTEEEVE
jgi:hypothetical protein